MPYKENILVGFKPEGVDKPHLGILTDDTGNITAIPQGATVFFILDPRRMDKIIPVILAKVSLNKLSFLCKCGDKNCTVRYDFVASRSGHHNPPMRHDRESLPK